MIECKEINILLKAKINQKKAEVVILISEKRDFLKNA